MTVLKSKTKGFKKSAKDSQAETPSLSIKERLAQKRKVAQARKELISIVSTVTFVSLFVGLAVFLVAGIKTAIPLVLGIIIMSLCYKYPRMGLIAFLIYVPAGGTITYYIGNSPILQLAKDAFYFPALIAIWQACRKQKLPLIVPPAIRIPLFVLLGTCLLTLLFVNGAQQFNPPDLGPFKQASNEIPLGMGILGLKVLLGYLPLMGCVYYLMKDKKDFLLISRLQVSLILICGTLGILQYLLLLTGICEGTRYATGNDLFRATLEARCYIGGSLVYSPSQGMIRLPGTFVAPWQWAWFLISSTFLAFATGFSDPSIIWRFISLGSMATVFINAVVSGQRIALTLVPVCFVILLVLTGQIGNLKRFIPIGAGLAALLAIAMASNPAVVEERVNSLASRWEASPPQEFIVQQFEDTLRSTSNPLGNGLGRATNSARTLGSTRLIETYYPKLLYEVGFAGTFAFLALVTAITIAGHKAYRSIKDRNLRTYAAAMWVFILFISYNTYYYPLDVDPVAVYYWFFAGILFKLPVIDKQEKENADPKQKNKKKRPQLKLL
ncbi:hormogonium polysaccharide biosynthesis protein HpsL [Anabaena sp. CCY 9910]|uniref:hormogonium polysaccharide biosynthesis protein HpsL n=1 Tax=Anabaena sp. CCY 9910 TaxID=3103870 RepID=UPI0039DFA5C3